MKLLLRNRLPPGDVLMLTAAVRDLHRAHPKQFITAVDTACPALWENNPLVVSAGPDWAPDRVIDCGYPLVHDANHRPYHFIHGFIQDLERILGVDIPAGPFRGDVYLSIEEMRGPSPLAGAGHDGPYWVVAAGGKYDFTAKWWDPDAWQAVIDHFSGRIRFVQCGAAGDWHPPLLGVVNLVGKTSVRDLIRVIYHADGVLCPVTFAMHLAAAVPARPGAPALRPCVVVAGGREPAHWEMYPGHQFLHTVGALDCCAAGGCWKSRCQPLGDGNPLDADLCVRPVPIRDGLQVGKCMTMIAPTRVIEAINTYYEGGVLRFGGAAPPQERAATSRRAASAGLAVAVTIGVGGYAEMAHLAAREMEARTGLPAVVLGDREFAESGLEDPTFLKFRLFDYVDADDLLYFDADTVCLEPWDPSPLFGDESIACVRERMIPLIRRESAQWSVPPAEHFNTGLFTANRRHHAQWLRLAESMRFLRDTALNDQLPLNAARCELGIPLRLIDRRFNWLGFGAGSLSHEFPVVIAHRLVPGRQDLNVAYFKGDYPLYEPRLAPDDAAAAGLHGRVFAFQDGAGDRRTVRFRGDGTLMPPADPDKEGYWFVHAQSGRPTLSLASETAVLHQFVRVLDGTWVGLSPAGAVDPSREGPRLIEQCDRPGPVLNEDNARRAADAFLRSAPDCPGERFTGRGIVVCGGGVKYFPCAWVCIRMLRHVGCELPIELWQLTEEELEGSLRAMVERYGVQCIDAAEVRQHHPVRALGGWQLKPFALLHSAFNEVMLIDADNVVVRDPTYLFDAPEYRAAGAAFWPDFERLAPDRAIWRVCGVPYRDEPEVESGQLLVDKSRCWRPLQLTMHLNEQSDFYYQYVHGDKETFHMAWRMLGQDYAMVPHPLEPLEGTMCQHDFQGRRVFQHRNMLKWKLGGDNPHVGDFRFEAECRNFLRELRERTPCLA